MRIAEHTIRRHVQHASTRLRAMFARLAAVDSGSVAAEYAFLVALIAIVAAFGMIVLGDDLFEFFQALSVSLDNAAQPTPDPFAT